jgi:2-phosphoglycerate kinase
VSLTVLIGGAPGAGKSALGRALAARLSATSLTADDIVTAAKAVTTPHSHPGLHVMSKAPATEYFTNTSPAQLVADADAQHEALWPAIEAVIRTHVARGPRIVIDGWSLRPEKVARLDSGCARSLWLVVAPAVLEERERRNVDFFGRSPDPERMLRNFLGRSLWYNDLIRRQAIDLGLPILEQDGIASVDSLCDQSLALQRLDVLPW